MLKSQINGSITAEFSHRNITVQKEDFNQQLVDS